MWNLEQRSGSFLARRAVTSFASRSVASRTPVSAERTPAARSFARFATPNKRANTGAAPFFVPKDWI
jgi:hypothetical protein